MLATVLLWPAIPWADEDADADANIVVGCHFSTGEFGHEAIDICVKENRAARAEVRNYPAGFRQAVGRCSRRWEPDWVRAKRCVDEEIAAAVVLETYARDHARKVEWCRNRFEGRGDHRVRICVEQSIEAERAGRAAPPTE
jgi:hypothetical protein